MSYAFSNVKNDTGFSFGDRYSEKNPYVAMSLDFHCHDVVILILSEKMMGRAYLTGAQSFEFQKAFISRTPLKLKNDHSKLDWDGSRLRVADGPNPWAHKTFSDEDHATMVEAMERIFSERSEKVNWEFDNNYARITDEQRAEIGSVIAALIETRSYHAAAYYFGTATQNLMRERERMISPELKAEIAKMWADSK